MGLFDSFVEVNNFGVLQRSAKASMRLRPIPRRLYGSAT